MKSVTRKQAWFIEGVTKHCFLTKMGKPISLKKDLIEFHDMFAKGLEDSQNKEEGEGEK